MGGSPTPIQVWRNLTLPYHPVPFSKAPVWSPVPFGRKRHRGNCALRGFIGGGGSDHMCNPAVGDGVVCSAGPLFLCVCGENRGGDEAAQYFQGLPSDGDDAVAELCPRWSKRDGVLFFLNRTALKPQSWLTASLGEQYRHLKFGKHISPHILVGG